jgi:hypothetical protein
MPDRLSLEDAGRLHPVARSKKVKSGFHNLLPGMTRLLLPNFKNVRAIQKWTPWTW